MTKHILYASLFFVRLLVLGRQYMLMHMIEYV